MAKTIRWGVRVRLLRGKWVVEQLDEYRRNKAVVISEHASEREADIAAVAHVRHLKANPPKKQKKVRWVMLTLFTTEG